MAREAALVLGGVLVGVLANWGIWSWAVSLMTRTCGHCGMPVAKRKEGSE